MMDRDQLWRRTVRQSTIGLIAGLVGGLTHAGLVAALEGTDSVASLGGSDSIVVGLAVHLILSAVLGMLFALMLGGGVKSSADCLANGLTFGFLWWVLISVIIAPILMGLGPQWQVEVAAQLLPRLFGFLLQGAVVGLVVHVVSQILGVRAMQPEVTKVSAPNKYRIVIIGGGFAGVTTAQHLERLLARDDGVEITLISDHNALLFTPLLSEVTASRIEARHISAALRAFFNTVRVVRAHVKSIDLDHHLVHLSSDRWQRPYPIPYDQIVLAVGSVPSFLGLDSIAQHAFTFKSLDDALRLRNHVIDMLERADSESDPARRRALLTFVVVGAGFAGAELIGGLNDLVRGSLWYYPNIPEDSVAMILVHSRERILPELSPELADYALRMHSSRGVTCYLSCRVVNATDGAVILDNGETVESETLVWTAGNGPHPLIAGLGLSTDHRGFLKVNETLAVSGHDGVWAIGDCASVPDTLTGQPYPQTAQHALHEAKIVARNVVARRSGRPLQPFRYRSQGTLAVLGHQTAVAEIYGKRFSGLFAWWLWRTIYLAKLPGLEKKIRVALDWTLDLFFPRDIVQTRSTSAPESATSSATDHPQAEDAS